jgi:hypothetical protein
MRLHNGGYSLKEIRARIEQNYKSKYRFMTPTPHPPHLPASKK